MKGENVTQRNFKHIRIVISLLVFVALLFLFLDIGIRPLKALGDFMLHFQFFPSILHFFALFFTIASLGFLLIILITIIFGRVYCSSICPLGTFQDILIAGFRVLKKKKNRRFHFVSNRKMILRYSIFAATIVLWISGSLFLVNLLDPYSNFGKISVSLFQPAYIWLHNVITFTLERFDIFILSPKSLHALPWNVVLISVMILLTLMLMTFLRGRLFCNTICPVGSALSLLSFKPLFRITFTDEACTFCKRCEFVCKAECLDSKNNVIDHSRCISCFNCLQSCPNNGIRYVFNPNDVRSDTEKEVRHGKRQFLLNLTAAAASIPLFGKYVSAQRGRGEQRRRQQQDTARQRTGHGAGSIPIDSRLPVTPPGSLSHEHFTGSCIACYLCVSACPTKVIVPSFYAYGLEGFMQPTLDFERSFCNYDCVKCTEVCPTGAITKQTREEKHRIQIGVVRFLVESCVVTADNTDCGACSEHCPTKAVQMVPYKDGLFIPEITPSLCVGCGACEFACPTEPYRAIYVTGRAVHRTARPISQDEGPREDDTDDFPF